MTRLVGHMPVFSDPYQLSQADNTVTLTRHVLTHMQGVSQMLGQVSEPSPPHQTRGGGGEGFELATWPPCSPDLSLVIL